MKAAIGTIDAWVKANIENQALHQSVREDLPAVRGRCLQARFPSDNGPGAKIVFLGALRLSLVVDTT